MHARGSGVTSEAVVTRGDRGRAGGRPRAARAPPADILHLAEAVSVVRQRLSIGAELADTHVLASLRAIATGTTPRERWLAAFNSTLGHWLALRGTDLNTALNTVIALVPPPRS